MIGNKCYELRSTGIDKEWTEIGPKWPNNHKIITIQLVD